MNRDDQFGAALKRARTIIEAEPARATGTVSLSLEMGDAIKCTTEAEGWTLEVEEPTSMGGDNSAPGSYIYGFSALASCFAMSLRMVAVRAAIKLEKTSLDVEGDYDDRAFFDVGAERTGYHTIRVKVDVVTDAESGDIENLIAEARRKSPWLNTFAR